jgi:hypothetical protein
MVLHRLMEENDLHSDINLVWINVVDRLSTLPLQSVRRWWCIVGQCADAGHSMLLEWPPENHQTRSKTA